MIKCKSLIYSFVEDSQHFAIAKSINAYIFAFEDEGGVTSPRTCRATRGKVEGEGGGQEKRVGTFISADKIVADATILKKVR